MSFPDTPPVSDNAGPAGLLTDASSPRSGLPGRGPVAMGSRLGTYSCGGSFDWRDGPRFEFPISPVWEPAQYGSRLRGAGGIGAIPAKNKSYALGLPTARRFSWGRLRF